MMVAERSRLRERSIRATSILLSLWQGLRKRHSVLFKEITPTTSLSQPGHKSPCFLLRYSPPTPNLSTPYSPEQESRGIYFMWWQELEHSTVAGKVDQEFLFSCQGQPTLAVSLWQPYIGGWGCAPFPESRLVTWADLLPVLLQPSSGLVIYRISKVFLSYLNTFMQMHSSRTAKESFCVEALY